VPACAAVPGRILLVGNDHERQRDALAGMLSDWDVDTLVAADGQEALQRLATFSSRRHRGGFGHAAPGRL
jgi:hypothetical protein